MTSINAGATVVIRPGDHFDIVLPCGAVLNIEQTADDFSICRQNGVVAYTTPTSAFAIADTEDKTQTTGRN